MQNPGRASARTTRRSGRAAASIACCCRPAAPAARRICRPGRYARSALAMTSPGGRRRGAGASARGPRSTRPGTTTCGPWSTCDDIAWRPASGRGRISTWTKVHKSWFPAFADETPYTVVQVELDEGPRLTSRLVDAGDEPIAIGARVEAVFTDVDADLTLHGFRLNAPEWRPAIDLAQSSRSVRPGINAADHGGHHAHSPRLRRPSPRRCRL